MEKTINIPEGMEVFFKPVSHEQKTNDIKAKIGYKGFDKDLKCRNHQFTLGEIAEKPEKESIKICSEDGFHYCNKLSDVFDHYSNTKGNRFCEVEILGNFKDDGDKSITTKLRVIRELSSDEIEHSAYEETINLPTIRKIQQLNPTYHVGGSAGLYLHGIRLDRIRNGWNCDVDLIAPYYTIPTGDATDKIKPDKGKRSANDFDESIIFNDVHCDIRIDPKQRYEIIVHNGFSYKVSLLEVIMAAKFKYALNGQEKHLKDVYEICGKKGYESENESINDTIDNLLK